MIVVVVVVVVIIVVVVVVTDEPIDWSFAVLELLREQGWGMKEMNNRWVV